MSDVTPTLVVPDLQGRLDTAARAARWPSGAASVSSPAGTRTAATGTLTGATDGPAATPEHAYRIGSITKTFTAVLVLRLRDEGRLTLADPLDRHLPGTRVGQVTLAQLLTHTSGLRAEPDGPWWERSHPRTREDLLAQAELRFGPGQRFHYSNLGYGLLGAVVEELRGAAWEEVLRAEVLDPLGMTATGLQPRGPEAPGLAVHPALPLVHDEPRMDGGALSPAGLLWSTVGDLARWGRFIAGANPDVLSAETLEEMCTPLAVQDGPGAWTAGQGLGFSILNVEGERFAGHTGSLPGFVSGLRVHRETGTGAAALCSSTAGSAASFALDLAREAAQHAATPSAPLTGEVEAALRAHVGNWYWGPYPYELSVTAEPGFRLGTPGQRGSRDARFRPDGTGGFIGLDGYFAGEPARFVTEADGTIWLEVASFCFTRTPYDPAAPIPGGLASEDGQVRGWYAP